MLSLNWSLSHYRTADMFPAYGATQKCLRWPMFVTVLFSRHSQADHNYPDSVRPHVCVYVFVVILILYSRFGMPNFQSCFSPMAKFGNLHLLGHDNSIKTVNSQRKSKMQTWHVSFNHHLCFCRALELGFVVTIVGLFNVFCGQE